MLTTFPKRVDPVGHPWCTLWALGIALLGNHVSETCGLIGKQLDEVAESLATFPKRVDPVEHLCCSSMALGLPLAATTFPKRVDKP